MSPHAWIKEFPGSVVVCDPEGTILEMNDRACLTFQKDGGQALIGKSLFDCHPGPARAKLERLLRGRSANAYTIEKNGKKKLVYQAPWFERGEYRGFVELSLEIPVEMPHFVRDP
jgi:transcriptional regulator with PAS, ATPase and Fis domain